MSDLERLADKAGKDQGSLSAQIRGEREAQAGFAAGFSDQVSDVMDETRSAGTDALTAARYVFF